MKFIYVTNPEVFTVEANSIEEAKSKAGNSRLQSIDGALVVGVCASTGVPVFYGDEYLTGNKGEIYSKE